MVMNMPTSLKTAGKESLGFSQNVGGFCSACNKANGSTGFCHTFFPQSSLYSLHGYFQCPTPCALGTLDSIFFTKLLLPWRLQGFLHLLYFHVHEEVTGGGRSWTNERYNIYLLFVAQTHSCLLTYKIFVWSRWDSASSQCVQTLCIYVLFPQKEVGTCIPLQLWEGQVLSIQVS